LLSPLLIVEETDLREGLRLFEEGWGFGVPGGPVDHCVWGILTRSKALAQVTAPRLDVTTPLK
jgi:hypothetical protein